MACSRSAPDWRSAARDQAFRWPPLIGHLTGKVFRRGWPDCRVLLAAGAGAGLATAFNAPIAGAIFVLEELVRRFELRVAIAALGASATAISVSRVLLGDASDFHVRVLSHAGAATRPLYFVLGALAGIAGVAFNRLLLATVAAVGRLEGCPVELRAGVIGAFAGVLAWFAPDLVGGGDPLTQRALLGADALALLPFIFLVRLGFGAISYAAGTPGGLFAPMLVLGAQLGLFFGESCQVLFPTSSLEPEGFAVVGMAAFFIGVVRAPLTGIVLVVEMTADVTMLLPMLGASFMAMLAPTFDARSADLQFLERTYACSSRKFPSEMLSRKACPGTESTGWSRPPGRLEPTLSSCRSKVQLERNEFHA